MPEREIRDRGGATEAQPISNDSSSDKGGVVNIRDDMRFLNDRQFLDTERGMVSAEARRLQEEITVWERQHQDDQVEIRFDAQGKPQDRELPEEIQRKTRELWRKNELLSRIAEAEKAAKAERWEEVAEFYQHRRTQLDGDQRALQAELEVAAERYRRARRRMDAREVAATGKVVADVEATLRTMLQRKEEYADRYAQVRVLMEGAGKS